MTEKINTKQLKPVATSLSATINSSTFVMTLQLKDQNNNNIGSEQTIDLPLESVVVSGEYDSENKKIVLTLQNGQEIDIPVGDLISGLQTEITSDNMLDADLVDDTTSTHKFVTTTEKTTWNGKQDAISDLATIRAGASAGATAVQPSNLGNGTITIMQGGIRKGTFTTNQSGDTTIELDAGGGSSYTAGDGINIVNNVISVGNVDCGTLS